MSTVPSAWVTKSLAEVCLPVAKVDPATTGRDMIRYVDIGSVDGTSHSLTDVAEINAANAPSRARQVLRTGDTVFSTVRPYLEKIAYIDSSLDSEFASTGFCILRPGPDVLPRYLFYYAVSSQMLEQVLIHQRGVSYPAVLDKNVRAASIPLPALGEQQRIVDILEDHLSRLDAGQQGLRAALKRLVFYEQTALANCRDGASTPLSDVAIIQGGIQKQPRRVPRHNAYPFLRVANVTKDGLALDDVHQIELFEDELERLRLQRGDLLVVEGNGSQSQIGRAAVWDGSIPDCVHQNHLIRVRPTSALQPEYLEAVWNSPQNRQQLMDLASSSSGLYTLSVSKLKSLSIPVPSIERQEAIARVLADVRQRRARLTHELDRALGRATRLRRSLLAAAFAGGLTRRSSDWDIVGELTEAVRRE